MSDEKYITDGGYGATSDDAKRGYSNQNVDDHEKTESWSKEYEEQQAHRNIGFGRDKGQAR